MNKRFLSVAASTAIVASAIVFTGCGSSSSSSTSTTTTSSGTSTGTFVKGLWAGVPYTYANGTKTGTTGNNGTYTFNTGDTVQFDLGLVKVNASGSTTPIAITDASVVTLIDPATGTAIPSGAANTTVMNNLLGAMLVIAGNQDTIESANGFDAASAITKLQKLQAAGLRVSETTFGGFANKLDLTMANATGGAVSAATGAKTQYTVASSDATALKTAIIDTATKAMTSSATTTGSLNQTRLNNAVLVFNDGSYINLYTNRTNITGQSIVNIAGWTSWNATGSAIKLGNANMSAYNSSVDTITLTSGLNTGSVVKVIAGNGATPQTNLTIANVYLDATSVVNRTWGFTTAQYNLNFTAATQAPSNASTNITMANTTQFVSGASTLNATVTGAYNQTLLVSPGNATCQLNLTFDRDFTQAGNRGVLSDIYVTVSSVLTTLLGYVKSVLASVGL